MRNLHENGNKVICHKCGKAYRRSEYLYEHLYKAHGEIRCPERLTWRRPNGQLIERRCKRTHNVALPQEADCHPLCSKKKAKKSDANEHAKTTTSTMAEVSPAISPSQDLGHILDKSEVEQASHHGENLLKILEQATEELTSWDQLNPTIATEETINWEDYLN